MHKKLRVPFLWIAFIHICRIRQELSYLHAMRPELICSALRCVIISRVHNIGFLISIVFCCMYSPPRGICLCLLLESGDAHDEFSCTVLCRPWSYYYVHIYNYYLNSE